MLQLVGDLIDRHHEVETADDKIVAKLIDEALGIEVYGVGFRQGAHRVNEIALGARFEGAPKRVERHLMGAAGIRENLTDDLAPYLGIRSELALDKEDRSTEGDAHYVDGAHRQLNFVGNQQRRSRRTRQDLGRGFKELLEGPLVYKALGGGLPPGELA